MSKPTAIPMIRSLVDQYLSDPDRYWLGDAQAALSELARRELEIVVARDAGLDIEAIQDRGIERSAPRPMDPIEAVAWREIVRLETASMRRFLQGKENDRDDDDARRTLLNVKLLDRRREAIEAELETIRLWDRSIDAVRALPKKSSPLARLLRAF